MILFKQTLILLLLIGSSFSVFSQTIVVNEFMADNDTLTQIVDEAGQYDDWIELHNLTNETVDLSGYYLSDDALLLQKWSIPNGTSISPNGYLIIWADNDLSQGTLHANFKLSKNGETIYFTAADNTFLDSIPYGPQDANITLARIPNGTGPFEARVATFGFNNDATSAVAIPLNNAAFTLYPSPATDYCYLKWTEENKHIYLDGNIYDTYGRLVKRFESVPNSDAETIELPIEDLTNGLYFIHLKTEAYHAYRSLIINK